MEYIYGAMLLHKAGKAVTEAALSKTLQAAGVAVDEGRVKATVAALKGVDIDEVISSAAVSAAPAAPAEAPAAPAEAPAGEDKPATEEKKEEPKDEVKEEEAAAGLGALFG